MNRACELSRPNASTNRCNSSHCVSMLYFAACSQPFLPLLEPPMQRPSRWRMGGGIESRLLQPFLRRQQSSVLNNQGTYFAVRYLDGSAYAKASENDCVALFPWFCHGFKQLVRQFSGKSHAWPLINTEVSLIIVHCVVTYLKDVFAEVATAFDKKCTIAR